MSASGCSGGCALRGAIRSLSPSGSHARLGGDRHPRAQRRQAAAPLGRLRRIRRPSPSRAVHRAPGRRNRHAVWLLESDCRALALVPDALAGDAWRAIELAGTPVRDQLRRHRGGTSVRAGRARPPPGGARSLNCTRRRRESRAAAVSTSATRDEQPVLRAFERTLIELLALERELIELDYVRRSDALERVRDAVRRLGEIGSPQGILERAAEELGKSSQLDRVLISEVADGMLEPRAIWSARDQAAADAALAALRASPIRLEYPLLEDEVVARQRAELVDVGASRSRALGATRRGARLERVRRRGADGSRQDRRPAPRGRGGRRAGAGCAGPRGDRRCSARGSAACSSARSCARRCSCTTGSSSRRSTG